MSKFLYRPVLRDVTDKVQKNNLDPYEAYVYLRMLENSLGLKREIYLSTSVTSGGHVHNPDMLDLQEIISRNTHSATLLANQLASDGQIDPESAVEPVFLGATGWRQSEYLEFWLMVIGGLIVGDREDTDSLRVRHRVAFEIADVDFLHMNSAVRPEERASEYFKVAYAMSGLYASKLRIAPIKKMIRLIDPDTSLGAQTERVFARAMNIPVYSVSVMTQTSPSSLRLKNQELAQDTEALISYGAVVFDTRSEGGHLVLTKQSDQQ